jgi:hypothetical protein
MDQLIIGFVNYHFPTNDLTIKDVINYFKQLKHSNTSTHNPTPTITNTSPKPNPTTPPPTMECVPCTTTPTTNSRITNTPASRCQARIPKQGEGYPARHGYIIESQCTRTELNGGLCGLHSNQIKKNGSLFCGLVTEEPPRPLVINSKQCFWIDDKESQMNKFDPSGPTPIKRSRGRPSGTKNKKSKQENSPQNLLNINIDDDGDANQTQQHKSQPETPKQIQVSPQPEPPQQTETNKQPKPPQTETDKQPKPPQTETDKPPEPPQQTETDKEPEPPQQPETDKQPETNKQPETDKEPEPPQQPETDKQPETNKQPKTNKQDDHPPRILNTDSSQYQDSKDNFDDTVDDSDDEEEETEFVWEGVQYTKLNNNTVINPRTMKSCGVWNTEINIIEFNDDEDEENHLEQK